MNTTQQENKYRFGLQGQDWLEGKLVDFGYTLYKKNLKQIGLELDLVMYKHIKDKNLVLIHIIEVKTRRVLGHSVDLEGFNLKRKWHKVRQIMFDIPDAVKEILRKSEVKTTITFDLAVVLDRGGRFSLHKYIQNVNLLL
ncbi:MAG: hypothetical protein V4686_02180 [Patescibacteria group bacterium]